MPRDVHSKDNTQPFNRKDIYDIVLVSAENNQNQSCCFVFSTLHRRQYRANAHFDKIIRFLPIGEFVVDVISDSSLAPGYASVSKSKL